MGLSLSGLSYAGHALKSARDYRQEEERFDTEQEGRQADVAAARQRLDIGRDQADQLQRQRAAEAEERGATADYYKAAAPGYPGFQQPQAAPAAAAPVAAPEAAPEGAPAAAPAVPAPAPAQPMPPSAVPGVTLQASPAPIPAAPAPQAPKPDASVAAPVAGQPGTALPTPPRPSMPAAAAPAAPGQPAGGRAGLLDVLAQKANQRGDAGRAQQIIQTKDMLEKEGFGQLAHQAMMDPTNTRKLEEIANANGTWRVAPGSLRYDGAGKYSGLSVMPDGSQRPFQGFDMLHAAMALGVIAPPGIKAFKTDEDVYQIGPTGTVNKLQEGNRYSTSMNRNGDIVTTNLKTGETNVKSAGGREGRMSQEQTKGISQIMTLVGRNATARQNEAALGKEVKPYDQSKTAGVAQSLFINNDALGKNAPEAVKIAEAIQDGDPDAKVGVAMLNGQQWNAVRYGKGRNEVVYGISPVAKPAVAAPQPGPAAPPAAARAPAPAATPAAAPAPVQASLPKPPPPRVASPKEAEAAGQEVDSLRKSISEANGKLHDINNSALKYDYAGAARVRAEIAKLQAAHKAAMERYSGLVNQEAVRERALKP